MSIISSLKADISAAKKLHLPWWGYVGVFAGGGPLIWYLDQIGRFDLALPVISIVGVFGVVIATKWKMRFSAWFWVTLLSVAIIHFFLISIIPWTTKWVPAVAIAFIGSVDICAIFALLSVVETFLRPKSTDDL